MQTYERPKETVSHYCLKITQLVSFRDRIRTKAAKILEMVSLVPCPRYQTQICSNTWDQPSSNLGSFVAGLARTRHHSSMIGLLLCPLEPSPNLGLHSRGVSCLVFLMAEVPVLDSPAIFRATPGQRHAWICVSSTPLYLVQLSQLQELPTVTCLPRALVLSFLLLRLL